MQQILTDQQRNWGERLIGRECVCVREDVTKKDPNFDAFFWERIITGPEQDLGVTQSYVVCTFLTSPKRHGVLKEALFRPFTQTQCESACLSG